MDVLIPMHVTMNPEANTNDDSCLYDDCNVNILIDEL